MEKSEYGKFKNRIEKYFKILKVKRKINVDSQLKRNSLISIVTVFPIIKYLIIIS